MAVKKSTTKTTTKARPTLELPYAVPEGIRVEPCTAMAEWMKTLYPDAPTPIFSTKALVHGKDAVGAKRIRPGFSFNSKMDLLWALGFPEVAFIVDGVPVPDTVEELKMLYRTEELFAESDTCDYWYQAQLKTGRLYTRRGAHARVWECDPFVRPTPEAEREEYAQSIFEQTDEDAEQTTSYRELDRAAVRKALIGSAFTRELESDSLLLEALVGPDCVSDVLVELLEIGTTRHPNYLVFNVLRPICLRLLPEDLERLRCRIDQWTRRATKEDIDSALQILDPDAYARGVLKANGEIGAFRMYLSREWEEVITKEACAEPSLSLNDPFTGDRDRVLAKLVRSHKGWDALDIDSAYLENLSAICSPLILPPLLIIGSQKWSKDHVHAWMRAHGEVFRADLEALARVKDTKLARLATQALKILP